MALSSEAMQCSLGPHPQENCHSLHLPTVASTGLGGGGAFPVWPVHTASTAPAAFSSSSLSDPPEELLSEATNGAFLVTHTFQAQGEVGPTAKEETLRYL